MVRQSLGILLVLSIAACGATGGNAKDSKVQVQDIKFKSLCDVLNPQLSNTGFRCLDIASEKRAGIWGPVDAIDSNTLLDCGVPAAAIATNQAGDRMGLNFHDTRKYDVKAGLDLKSISKWLPSGGAKISGSGEVDVDIEFDNLTLHSTQNLEKHLSTALKEATSGAASCIKKMCNGFDGLPAYYAQRALLAIPVVTIKTDSSNKIDINATLLGQGFEVDREHATAGVFVLKSKTPIVIAAQTLPMKTQIAGLCTHTISDIQTFTANTTIQSDLIEFNNNSALEIKNGSSLLLRARRLTVNGSATINGTGAPGAPGSKGRNGNGGVAPNCRNWWSGPNDGDRPLWPTGNRNEFIDANVACDACSNCDCGLKGGSGGQGSQGARVRIELDEPIRGVLSIDVAGGPGGPGGPSGLGQVHQHGGQKHTCPDGGPGGAGMQGPPGTCELVVRGSVQPCNW